jgi:hypothetical protein
LESVKLKVMLKAYCGLGHLIFLFCIESVAQRSSKDSTTVLMGSQLHYGFIIPHSADLTDIAGSNPFGITAEVSRIRHTQKAWSMCNCISQSGVGISYYNFNNPEELGSGINLILFTEPQLTIHKLNLSVRAAAGLSYLSKVYHPESNPNNLFFSKHFSGLLQVQFNSRLWLSDYWSLRTGVSYNHISNGGARQPNKGMNFPMVNLGVEHAINPLPFRPRKKLSLPDRSVQYYAGVFFNTRAVDEGGSTHNRKAVVGIQSGFFKPVGYMHGAGVAIEFSRDGVLKERARLSQENYDHRIVSLLLRHHFLFGRFDLSQALGIYLHHDTPRKQNVFQRYALEYALGKRLKAGFSLKAHLHVAEQMDVRVMTVF